MSSCEKCWSDSRYGNDYFRVLDSRKEHPCTPEEQAGPDAGRCPTCGKMTLHQHTKEPMCGCVPNVQIEGQPASGLSRSKAGFGYV